MSKKERNTLALLLGVGLVGHGLRVASGQFHAPPGQVALLGAGLASDSSGLAGQIARSARLARPLADGERIDVNRASTEELGRLPKVGPRLAKRIVEDRERNGPFMSVAELDRVPGIGPAMASSIAPFVALPAGEQAPDTIQPKRRQTRRAIQQSDRPAGGGSGQVPTVYLRDLPLVESPGHGRGPGGRRMGPVNVNTASVEELISLPGIGRSRAQAIVAYRQGHGPFASVNDLEKVPGLGQKLVRQLVPQVTLR